MIIPAPTATKMTACIIIQLLGMGGIVTGALPPTRCRMIPTTKRSKQ